MARRELFDGILQSEDVTGASFCPSQTLLHVARIVLSYMDRKWVW